MSVLRISVFVVAALQLAVAIFLASQAYSPRDMMMTVALAVLPILAIRALRGGPDSETCKLRAQVEKARLRRELKDLEGQV